MVLQIHSKPTKMNTETELSSNASISNEKLGRNGYQRDTQKQKYPDSNMISGRSTNEKRFGLKVIMVSSLSFDSIPVICSVT